MPSNSSQQPPVKNLPIEFKPREFLSGIAIAAAIVLAVAGTRWVVRARTISTELPSSIPAQTNSNGGSKVF